MQQALEFDDVSFVYRDTIVLEKANVSLAAGRFLLVLGPNGGGKTTLAKLALGLLRPLKGAVYLFGQRPANSLHLVGYVPQVNSLSVHFPIDVSEVVRLGLYGHQCSAGILPKEHIERVLEAVSLTHLKDRQFSSLSGGERQRVLIARALISDPKLLILDEPTANIDIKSKSEIYALLEQLQQTVSIMLVSHDPEVAKLPVDDVLHVNRTTCQISPDAVSSHAITELIKRHSLDQVDSICSDRIVSLRPNKRKVYLQ